MGTADKIFHIMDEADMPDGPPAVILEVDGQPHWLIRAGAPLTDVVAELNVLGTHLVHYAPRQPRSQPKQGGSRPPPCMRHAS